MINTKADMLSERIKKERTALRMTQSQLGKLVGVDKSSISQWETGHVQNISGHNLIKLAIALGVTSEWLESGQGEKRQLKSIDGEICNVIKKDRRARSSVPLLTWEQLGKGDVEHDHWINCPSDHSEDTYALKVKSDAMYNTILPKSYPKGSFIFIDEQVKAICGSKVIGKLKNGAYVFRELIEDAGKRYLKPLNPVYEMIEMTEGVEIIGVIVGTYTPE